MLLKKREKELWLKDEKTGETLSVFKRPADNNDRIVLNDIGSLHGLYFFPTKKADSLEAMVNEVRLFISAGKLKVSPSCTQLLGCLKYGIWDKNRKAFERSEVYGHYDAFAALMYLIRNLDLQTNPIPPLKGG